MITREEAQKIVDVVTFKVEQPSPYPPCKAVAIDDARQLIGEKHFAKLEKDRIRFQGSRPGTLYPWNVVDYLVPAMNEDARQIIRTEELPLSPNG
jgi:hypothetical protein